MAAGGRRSSHQPFSWPRGPAAPRWASPSWPWAGALALLAAVRPSGLKSPAPGLLTRGLAWCGKRCYSLYLFHFPIMGLTYVAAGGLNPLEETHASATLVVLSLVLVFAFADLSYRVVEKPLMAMANRLTPYVRKKRPAMPEA